jgi:hypothetical protein
VGWVKSSFFKHRKFHDETDLRAQLEAWHVEVNTQTPSRATGVIPEIRRQEELARLRPVKVFPETLPLRIPIVVGPTAEVMFEGPATSSPAAIMKTRETAEFPESTPQNFRNAQASSCLQLPTRYLLASQRRSSHLASVFWHHGVRLRRWSEIYAKSATGYPTDRC